MKNINNRRMELLHKGFVNQSETAEFFGLGRNKGGEIYKSIERKLNSNGIKTDILGIRTVHLLDYLGLTEEEVRRYAKEEREVMTVDCA